MDERRGRHAAEARALRVIGTVGVLIEAARRGHVPDLRALLDALRGVGFISTRRSTRRHWRPSERLDANRNQGRNVLLPSFLAYYRLAGAAVEDGWLCARFVSDDAKA